MKVGLLISTYNWTQSLNLVLKSTLIQTCQPDEILIADDGSTDETKLHVERFQQISTVPIRHIWQEDKGFRKAKILNKTVAQATSDYIIQIDGDCIMHPKFVADHKKKAEKHVYLFGSRVNILPDSVSEVFLKEKIIFNIFSNEIKNKTRTLHIPFVSELYKPHNGISKKFRGCNVSFWREDFISINGYNEDYEGWGREDSDLVIRMGNNGVKAKRLRYAAIVYHIYHKNNSKQNFELNDKLQMDTIENKVVTIKNGVNQYLK